MTNNNPVYYPNGHLFIQPDINLLNNACYKISRITSLQWYNVSDDAPDSWSTTNEPCNDGPLRCPANRSWLGSPVRRQSLVGTGGSSCLNGYSQPLTKSCWLLINQASDQIKQKSSHNKQLTLNSWCPPVDSTNLKHGCPTMTDLWDMAV